MSLDVREDQLWAVERISGTRLLPSSLRESAESNRREEINCEPSVAWVVARKNTVERQLQRPEHNQTLA
jgi:hypothetical protein